MARDRVLSPGTTLITTLAVRDPAAVAWLTHRLDRAIQAAARQVAEAPLTVQFITDSVEGLQVEG